MKSVCITEKAYAKLNLSLRIVDKLPNKFHSIQSHVTFLPELFDTLHIKKSTKTQAYNFFSLIKKGFLPYFNAFL